jgi:asparagine synthetase B (glutamine-hydrolysing)
VAATATGEKRTARGSGVARRMLPPPVPGIVGVVDASLTVEASAALAGAMAARLRTNERLRLELDPQPRSPVVLGRVHLGVLDGTRAPARSPDGSCRLVLCGEVRDRPGGAAELLADYLERGGRALRGLSGSFALALWDGRRRRCHLVNDRFGLRNVYYAATAERLLFAPQLPALLADARVPRALDPQAAAEFLVFQCVLLDRTLLAAARLLPPASLLVFEPGRGARLERTWELRYRPRPAPPAAHAAALADALRGAVARQAAGPARVALPLSGGLDSRALLAAMPSGRAPLHAVTYGRLGCDDVLVARRLARLTGAVHHTIVLRPGYIADQAETMLARTGGMHSCLNAHAVLLGAARAFCDLILLGNGGDCLLDGLWSGPPDSSEDELLARLLARLEIGVPRALAEELVAPGAPFAGVAERAAAGLRAALAPWRGAPAAERCDAFNVVHRHHRWVLQGVPAQAPELEYRHPYYDDDVVAAALEVPAGLRAHRAAHVAALRLLSPALARVRRQGKPFGFTAPAWCRRVHEAGERAREAIRWRANRAGMNPMLTRPDRRGFADYNDELRHGSRALLEGVLLAPRTLERGFWRGARLRRLVEAHLLGHANHAHALGVVLTLELFARRCLDGEAPAAAEGGGARREGLAG